ncbi:MAG: DUF2764 family protein [Pirellulaceae bacterium]|nr:DUF2764 family protein [Pirellulaceae bacterium]
MGRRTYYDLIASLPGLPIRFDVERPPISGLRLMERLQILDADDAAVVEQWTNFVGWDRQVLERTDDDVAQSYHRLIGEISNATLLELIQHRMDTRTIIAAIRRRRAGMPPPTGVGQWVDKIRRDFQHPQFQLQTLYPWIGRFDQLMGEGQALEAQRIVFEFNYRELEELAPNDMFSFEAILIYLVRWEIIDRWTSLDEAAGKTRFETMIRETLGEYAHLFEPTE